MRDKKENTSEETNDEYHKDKPNNVDSFRNTNPHWLIHELNDILEKGMFKHD